MKKASTNGEPKSSHNQVTIRKLNPLRSKKQLLAMPSDKNLSSPIICFILASHLFEQTLGFTFLHCTAKEYSQNTAEESVPILSAKSRSSGWSMAN